MAWDLEGYTVRLAAASTEAEVARACAEELVHALGARWAAIWRGTVEDRVLFELVGEPGSVATEPGPESPALGHGAVVVVGPGAASAAEAAVLVAISGFAFSAAHERAEAGRERRTLARLLFHVPSMIALTRGPEHVIEVANEAFLRTRRLPSGALLGVRFRDALPGLAAQGFVQLADRVYQTGQRFVGDEIYIELRYEDAAVGTWQNMVLEPLRDDSGAVDGILMCGTDVTDLVRARKEADAVHAERARSQNELVHVEKVESLSRLASGVAHDFNNLLGVIGGNLELLEIEIGNPVAARARMKALRAATGRATELTRQLMSFAGRGVATGAVVDLVAASEEVLSLLRTSVRSGIRLHTRLPPGPLLVRGERAPLQQLLSGLFLNGVDALAEGGGALRVTLSPRTVEAGEPVPVYGGEPLPPGPYASMAVSDDGHGMSDETKRRVFDPFFSTRPGGRGLGLSGALGIVRALGGGIRLTSAPGAGTSFEVLLPRVEAQVGSAIGEAGMGFERFGAALAPPAVAPAPSPAPVPSVSSARTAILVVDDDEGIRELLELALEPLGFAVLTAMDGATALAAAAEHGGRIGVVLLDLSLPDCSPDEIFRELREALPGVPFALCTGSVEEDARRLVGGGAGVTVLMKPFDMRALLRTVAEAFATGA